MPCFHLFLLFVHVDERHHFLLKSFRWQRRFFKTGAPQPFKQYNSTPMIKSTYAWRPVTQSLLTYSKNEQQTKVWRKMNSESATKYLVIAQTSESDKIYRFIIGDLNLTSSVIYVAVAFFQNLHSNSFILKLVNLCSAMIGRSPSSLMFHTLKGKVEWWKPWTM